MVKAPYPTDRSELISYAHDRMVSGITNYKDEKKLEFESGLFKSFFVEADRGKSELRKFLKTELDTDIEFLASNDENYHPIRLTLNGEKELFIIDNKDERFWVFHTFGLARITNQFTDKISRSAFLDTAWLPMQFLQGLTDQGFLKGFAARFDNDVFVSDDENRSKISMRLWGNLASEVVKTFQQNPLISQNLSISGVRLRTSIEKDTNAFAIEDINYRGKVTVLGDSILSHFNFINETYLNRYSYTIREKIEHKHSIRVSNNVLHGEPIFIEFSRVELDIASFTKAIFSASNPFKLWGLSEIIKDDFARVYAVDMHVGSTLTFEVFKNSIRIFIEENCCGNSIARFFTLFQQHYDASARLIDGNANDIF